MCLVYTPIPHRPRIGRIATNRFFLSGGGGGGGIRDVSFFFSNRDVLRVSRARIHYD